MPSTRTRKKRHYKPDVSPAHWAMLNDEQIPEDGNPFDRFTGPSQEQWDKYKGEILENWIKSNPGTRPSYWWQFEAPAPRKRLGGTGDVEHDVLNVAESYNLGLPDGFIDASDAEIWNDLTPIDPEDPPRYESQAAYLDRLGLLTSQERKRLTKADFEPVKIEAD